MALAWCGAWLVLACGDLRAVPLYAPDAAGASGEAPSDAAPDAVVEGVADAGAERMGGEAGDADLVGGDGGPDAGDVAKADAGTSTAAPPWLDPPAVLALKTSLGSTVADSNVELHVYPAGPRSCPPAMHVVSSTLTAQIELRALPGATMEWFVNTTLEGGILRPGDSVVLPGTADDTIAYHFGKRVEGVARAYTAGDVARFIVLGRYGCRDAAGVDQAFEYEWGTGDVDLASALGDLVVR